MPTLNDIEDAFMFMSGAGYGEARVNFDKAVDQFYYESDAGA